MKKEKARVEDYIKLLEKMVEVDVNKITPPADIVEFDLHMALNKYQILLERVILRVVKENFELLKKIGTTPENIIKISGLIKQKEELLDVYKNV